MQALVPSETLFANGAVEIHHCQQKRYYVQLCAGKTDGTIKQRLALEAPAARALRVDMEDDVEDPLPQAALAIQDREEVDVDDGIPLGPEAADDAHMSASEHSSHTSQDGQSDIMLDSQESQHDTDEDGDKSLGVFEYIIIFGGIIKDK